MAYQIGWFSTGRDQTAIDLLKTIYEAIQEKIIPAEITFCFSNRDWGEAPESDRFFRFTQKCGITLIQFSSQKFQPDLRQEGKKNPQIMEKWRVAFDREIMKRLQSYQVDLIILAGYMLIVGPEMCRRFRMINLHPALPGGPTGTWQEVMWQLIKKKAEETGAMMHLVTPELDKGPPVSYFSFPLKGEKFDPLWKKRDKTDLFNAIRAEEVKRELPLILLTIKEFAEGNITIKDQKIFTGEKLLEKGYDLTDKIEKWLKRREAKVTGGII